MAARRGSEPDAAESNRSIPSVAVLPQVSLDFNAQPNRSCVDDGDATPYLRVSQLVYDSGRAASDLAAARAHELESRGNQLQPAAATALAVVETRILGLDRRKLLDVIRQNLVIHEEIKRLITGQVSDKFGSNADVMTAQPQTADVQRDYADAQERQTMAEAGFLLSTYATLILTGGVLDLRWITLDKWDGSL
ncbi:TolC family protein [Ruegeria sp. ANG-R]|uniref:TolC family protein n=1 Tax=Ruegeria sp. ANG-R TaxID=1577903 RepID=UPI00187CA86C|nr:TolC family protein [Ruegeria sp. ANG-R]